jgi:hypothetical protein
MLFGIYIASDRAEYIGAGSTVEEFVEELELLSGDKPLNMEHLQVFDGIPVRVVQHTVYKVVPI